jgi:fused signal recognition particle receptor
MMIFDKIKNLISKKDEELFKYETSLKKSRNALNNQLVELALRYKNIDEDYFEELEEILIMSDVGVMTVMTFIDRLKERVSKENITDPKELNEVIVDELFIIYVDDAVLSSKINYNPNGMTVLLMVGVNGVGKTTSIAKLAHRIQNEGRKVVLAAGDTFRAGAVEQLEMWGDRIGCDVIKNENTTDPSSVMFDAIKHAKEVGADVLICDTAGRLQNKQNLMNELEKINRVIGREIPNAPHETLLVIDATTGQNGISQATAFNEATDLTGIILTKLDGTAKGGIVLAIKEKVNIPVKFIGLGESIEDLRPFDIEKYIYGLFSELF